MIQLLIYNTKMGSSSSKNKKESQYQPQSIENQYYYDEVVEVDECCGFQRKRTIKKGLIWEDRFMLNCQDLKMYYQWVHDVEDVVKVYGRKLPRKKFIQQFNGLKKIARIDHIKHEEILLSPSQIDQFKINLKNSVLVSYGQAVKPPRPKQSSKIQSIMFSTGSKNQKKTNTNSSFKNAPSKSDRKQRKRSDVFQLERKQSILRQRQSLSKSHFRSSIMSFVDDTMSSFFRGQQKQISKQSAYALQIFVKFSLILQKHLNSSDSIIGAIIQAFRSYIYKKYTIFNNSANQNKEQLSQLSQKQKQILNLEQMQQKWKIKVKKQRFKQLQNRKSLTTEQIQQLTSDINMFLILLRQIVQDYYKTMQFAYEMPSKSQSNIDYSGTQQLHTNFLITNQDNILILVTGILFKNEKFYNHIINIITKYNQERQKNFEKIIQNLKGRPPQYFQIKRQYCLNNLTIQKYLSQTSIRISLQEQQKTKSQSSQKQSKSFPQCIEKGQSTVHILTPPYMKCVQVLQKLVKSKTPTSKMKVIMECSQKITQCVSQFYNTNNLQLKNQMLDADQILSIFCYILSLNPVQNLISNLFMIENFATQNQMISITGYYYSVLTCAVQQLENMYSSTVADISTFGKTESEYSNNNGLSKKKNGNRSNGNISPVKTVSKAKVKESVNRSFSRKQ